MRAAAVDADVERIAMDRAGSTDSMPRNEESG
jgi:hypothetical protein